MRFFRRGDAAPQGGDFWGWWAGARDRIAQAIETASVDQELVEELTKALRAVDKRLAWEFGSGESAKFSLAISPEGDAEVRPIALRLVAAAPPADATWEYHASRQASETARIIEIGGERVDFDEMRAVVSWDSTRRRLDVRLWHPVFATAPEQVRGQLMFLFLDGVLGEDNVERWIGAIEPLDGPVAGRTPAELKAEIERHAAEPAEDTWVLGQRMGPSGPTGIVMANAALKRIDLPFADQHVSIAIGIEGGGMPDNALAEQLNAEEDRLAGQLEGAAVLAGRETSPGERVIHFVAEDLERVRAGIDAWAADAPEWRVKVNFQHDPAWEFQREIGAR